MRLAPPLTRGYFFLSALSALFSIDKTKISSGTQGKNKLINLVTRAATVRNCTLKLSSVSLNDFPFEFLLK